MKFNVTPSHFEQLLKQSYSLDHIFLLKLVEANVDIQPTSVFMGSIYSTSDNYRVRPNARPADDMGNLCSLVAGPGQILAIRQTIYQESDGNPVLELHQLEQSGNIIDGNGVWLTELPMNLDYFVTNEFGEKIDENAEEDGSMKAISNDPNEILLQQKLDVTQSGKVLKKEYTPIKSYKPTGNFVYDEALLNKIEDKFM